MVGNSCFHFKTVASFSFFVTEPCDLVFSASEVLSNSRSGVARQKSQDDTVYS